MTSIIVKKATAAERRLRERITISNAVAPNRPTDEGGTAAKAGEAFQLSVEGDPVVVIILSEGENVTIQREDVGKRIQEFSDRVYALCKKDRRREAIDEVLDYFDDLLIERRFAVCDETLGRLDERNLTSSVMVSILGITLRAKRKLRLRDNFYARVESEIGRSRGRAYAKELLKKYF